MSLQPSSNDEYKFIVLPTVTGGLYAEEFRMRFYEDKQCQDEPNPELSVILSRHELKDITLARQKILHYFQRTVMGTYGEDILESAGATDELLFDPDPDTLNVYKVYKEFKRNYPTLDVVTMLPVDMLGSFGFVVHHNDMYS